MEYYSSPQETEPDLPWNVECLPGRHGSAVTCRGHRGSGCSRCARNRVWLKYSLRRSPLAPLWSN